MEAIGFKVEKILVTGCSGFIGMHLCESLLKDGFYVYGVDNMNDYYSVDLKKTDYKILMDMRNLNFPC